MTNSLTHMPMTALPNHSPHMLYYGIVFVVWSVGILLLSKAYKNLKG